MLLRCEAANGLRISQIRGVPECNTPAFCALQNHTLGSQFDRGSSLFGRKSLLSNGLRLDG